jgi:quercetin dioxygenase-like cupin family protein
VHDEDRLLIIESGQMDFWNCLGARHTYVPGDMAFIPKHRLHGSVVLSGECVYHQPVISAELDARFG